MPFLRYAKDRIIFDKKVGGIGISFSGQSIEVNSEVEGLQFLFSNDSIRINNKMEYAILLAKSDVTISSQIDRSVIIFAGEKITITDDAKIKGDVICFSPNIELNGNIDGSVLGYADNIVVNGNIGKDLRINTENVSIEEELVKGNLYIQTSNNDHTLPDNYENAIINIIENREQRSNFNFSVVIMAIITGAVFTLLYYLINKVTKNKFTKSSVNKVKENTTMVVLSGAILLMVIPVVVMILILLSAFGLYMVAVPALIIYSSFLLVVGLLSTFIIGTFISEYMSETKYLNEKGKNTKYLFSFIMYMILYIFARLPYVGGYVTSALVILAVGVTVCIIFKKEKNCNNENKNIEEIKTEEKA